MRSKRKRGGRKKKKLTTVNVNCCYKLLSRWLRNDLHGDLHERLAEMRQRFVDLQRWSALK